MCPRKGTGTASCGGAMNMIRVMEERNESNESICGEYFKGSEELNGF